MLNGHYSSAIENLDDADADFGGSFVLCVCVLRHVKTSFLNHPAELCRIGKVLPKGTIVVLLPSENCDFEAP